MAGAKAGHDGRRVVFLKTTASAVRALLPPPGRAPRRVACAPGSLAAAGSRSTCRGRRRRGLERGRAASPRYFCVSSFIIVSLLHRILMHHRVFFHVMRGLRHVHRVLLHHRIFRLSGKRGENAERRAAGRKAGTSWSWEQFSNGERRKAPGRGEKPPHALVRFARGSRYGQAGISGGNARGSACACLFRGSRPFIGTALRAFSERG